MREFGGELDRASFIHSLRGIFMFITQDEIEIRKKYGKNDYNLDKPSRLLRRETIDGENDFLNYTYEVNTLYWINGYICIMR